MRNYYISLLLVSCMPLMAKQTVEILAKNVKAYCDKVEAYDDIVVLYDDSVIKADSAFFDKNTSLLTLRGKVEVLSKEGNRVGSDELILNTKKKDLNFKDTMLSTQNNLWIKSYEGKKIGQDMTLGSSRLSSCDVAKPDWELVFDEAYLHNDDKYATLWNAKLKFFDNTIFYFPYFAFPTLNERTTGLLVPHFNISSKDGFTYEQPIFIVPDTSWDIELKPQIRTNRGEGVYATTRFIDSNTSKGDLTLGYFKNSASYAKEHSLDDSHYGAEFHYEGRDMFSDEKILDDGEYHDGMYANFTYLNNGLEYLNLQKNSLTSLVTSNLVESRFNYFLDNHDNYFGLYGKYYIDASKKDNTETLQNLPTLHYHKYFDNVFFSEDIFYTLDAKVNNYTRSKGSSGTNVEINLPMTYEHSFFNDYLNLALFENIYANYLKFRTPDSEDYKYFSNYHQAKIFTDLTKGYEEYRHVIQPSISYILPRFDKEYGISYTNLTSSQKELFTTQIQEEKINFDISQYLYNDKLQNSFFQRLGYLSFPARQGSNSELYNELGYMDDEKKFYNNVVYSPKDNEIKSITTSGGYKIENYDIMLTHFLNNDTLSGANQGSFIDAKIDYKLDNKNSLYANADYDVANKFNHKWDLGYTHKQQCWGGKIAIGQETIPNLTKPFVNSRLYFELNFYPLGGIKQNIEKELSPQ